jgi:predicted phosphodiesterase
MRLGVLSDVHGNEVALRAVLADAASCRVDLVERYGLMAAGIGWTRGRPIA